MARFRRKAKSRGFGKRLKRYARKSGVGRSANLIQVDAMLYGAVRAPISDFVAGVIPIPVIGNVGDELAMGLIDYLVAKNTSGMLRDVAVKGLVVENARLGEAVAGMTGLTGMAAKAGSSGSAFLYG
jgi:hypothetical protein